MNPNQPTAPNQRTFSLNSKEFYEAVTPPPDPWGWGPRLPREPRVREPEVIVEVRARRRDAIDNPTPPVTYG